MARSRSASVKALSEWLRITPAQARELKDAIDAGSRGRRAEEAMQLADRLTEAHGVEAIEGEEWIDNYYGNIVASYVNMGDAYSPTLVHESKTGRFILTDWASWVERNQKRYGIR